MPIAEYWLSIWEIAHRWTGHDPDHTDPKKLPLEVQDYLRCLTRALIHEEFHVHNENGIQYCNPSDVIGFDDYQSSVPDLSVKEDEYWAHYDARTKKYLAAVEDLELCYKKRIYDKPKLESIFFTKPEVYRYAINEGIPVPEFWISASDIKGFRNEKLGDDGLSNPNSVDERVRPGRPLKRDIDRLVCRAVAAALWSKDPSMTIEGIIRHEVTQTHGNSKVYTSKNTVRDWIKDLDPRPKGKKSGAPKKL